jgi:glucose-6-phosphate isomerase
MEKDDGITHDDIDSLKDRIKEIHTAIVKRELNELFFLDLPNQDTREIITIADNIRSNSEYFLLLGIGGSALGPRALLEALKPFYNLKNTPKIFIYDNVDPATLKSILSMIDLRKTTVNVITKSGSTVETMASFLILKNALKKVHKKEFSKWIIATTDPEKGILREIALREGFRSLPVHPHVVGRFSVLSPVGLLLSAVSGIDIKDILRGAKDMVAKCNEENIWKNPAYMYGALMYLMEQKKGKNISVLISYSDRLKAFSEWYCQLWSESLGKNNHGQTPYPSIGTTDQHSQLQLWIEGPRDKVITFISIEDYRVDVSIPDEDIEQLDYLKNHTLGELIKAEQEATELALVKAGRLNMRINVPRIDSYYMGQLFLFFELATVVTGLLYGINPFNQPGVEEGKNLTYGIMGRKGYEDKKEEVKKYREKVQKSRYRI